MLMEMLRLLDQGQAYSQSDLARLLHTSQEAVMLQIEYLSQLGYLKKVELSKGGCASGSCKGCPVGCGQEKEISQTAAMPVFWETGRRIS